LKNGPLAEYDLAKEFRESGSGSKSYWRQERMKDFMEKKDILDLKQEGKSNREVARYLGINRKTVAKYWNEYKQQISQLNKKGADTRTIQDDLYKTPTYQSSDKKRKARKYTEEIAARLQEILGEERRKNTILGVGHKQKLTNKQIHQKLVDEGFDISCGTINNKLAVMRDKKKEVFIRQEYDFGERLEYDFGEVRLDCGEGVKTYHMAVLSSPGGKFRWCYLYTNQKKAVFMDSHVKFFEMMGGGYHEVVYDNMRNVVTKFIGKNEKELNEDLLKMSLYYGFKINVTNCFKANEKGSVEKSVDVLRNEIFADTWKFNSLEDAQTYLHSKLLKLNENSEMEKEQQHLTTYRPPLELAMISENKVNTSSMISVDTAFYSVPEHLVDKRVIVKKYHDEIRIFANNIEVCRHKRIFGLGKMQVDIYHYLNTLFKKPGAVRNSVALKQIPRLKAIFDTHYADKPKQFIQEFMDNKHLAINEIITYFEEKTAQRGEFIAISVVKPISSVVTQTRAFIANYSLLVNKGGRQ
jgi:transposase